jgi:hypothetical protein
MIWILAIVCLIGLCAALLLLKGRNKAEAATPSLLADLVLRHPERMLLDIPRFMSTTDETEAYRFLMETEAELSRMGVLQMRRQLVTCIAGVFKAPSKHSTKEMTDFLFNSASKEFREVLRWNKRCEAPLQFLRVLHILIESLESGQDLERNHIAIKDHEKINDTALDELKGEDRDIAKEWHRLFLALYETVYPKEQKHKGKRSAQSRSHKGLNAQERSALGNGVAPPKTLHDPGRAPHLLPFQKVANEVYRDFMERHCKPKTGGASV